MYKIFFFLSISGIALKYGNAHTYGLGYCPDIDSVPKFNITGFLGLWYVVQQTKTGSTCITVNISPTKSPDEYLVEEASQLYLLNWTPLDHQFHYTGHLLPEVNTSKMALDYDYTPGRLEYTVFLTDYENYAATFSCQDYIFFHRKSATILSRKDTLDPKYVDQIRTRLASYNVNPFDLSLISHQDCPKNTTGSYHINFRNDVPVDNEAGVERNGISLDAINMDNPSDDAHL